MQGKGVPTEYIEKQYKKGTLEHIESKLDPKRLVLLKYPCVITVSINDWFGASASAPTSYLINWGWNPFSESLAWFVKKSKQLNQSYMASDITAFDPDAQCKQVQMFCDDSAIRTVLEKQERNSDCALPSSVADPGGRGGHPPAL